MPKNNVIDARKKFKARKVEGVMKVARKKIAADQKKDFGFKRKRSNDNKKLVNVRTKTGVRRTSKIKKAELNKVEARILFTELSSTQETKLKSKAKKKFLKANTKLGKVTVKEHNKETKRLKRTSTSLGGSMRKLIRNSLIKMLRKRTR